MSELQKLTLYYAIKRDDFTLFQELVTQNPALATTTFGYTGLYPIHMAAQNNCLKIMQLVCEKNKAVLNQKDSHGYTPLMWAAFYGHIDCARYLINQGADLDEVINASSNQKTALYLAAEQGHLNVVDSLLEAGASNVQRGSLRPITHVAAEKGFDIMVRALLGRNSAWLEAPDTFQQTPLIWAASAGHAQLVEWLLDQGAKLDAATYRPGEEKEHQFTALHWAVIRGHLNVVTLLINKGANPDGLLNGRHLIHFAVDYGELSVVEFFFESNHQLIEQEDADGQTPLILAASKGQEHIVEYLVQNGAQLNKMSMDDKKTALHGAVIGGFCNVVKILVRAGAVDTVLQGKSLIRFAVGHGHLKCAQFLFEEYHHKSIDVLTQLNERGETLLLTAARMGHDKIVKYLIEQCSALNLLIDLKQSLEISIKGEHYKTANIILLHQLNTDTEAEKTRLNCIKSEKHAFEFIVDCPEKAELALKNPRIRALITQYQPCGRTIHYYKPRDRRPSFFAQISRETGASTVFHPHKTLGQGACGVVRDFMSASGTHIAVKSLKDAIDMSDSLAELKIQILEKRLVDEAHFMSTIYPTNSGLYKAFSFKKDYLGDNKYTNVLVTEYLEGEPAHLFIATVQCKMALAKIILSMAEALLELHKHHVIHGDIKLDNMLIVANKSQPLHYKVKYIDFGMAYSVLGHRTVLAGNSPHYAPERIAPASLSELFSSKFFALFLKPHVNQDVFSFAMMLSNLLYVHNLGLALATSCPSIIRFIEKTSISTPDRRPDLQEFVAELSLDYQISIGEISVIDSEIYESDDDYALNEDWVEIKTLKLVP